MAYAQLEIGGTEDYVHTLSYTRRRTYCHWQPTTAWTLASTLGARATVEFRKLHSWATRQLETRRNLRCGHRETQKHQILQRMTQMSRCKSKMRRQTANWPNPLRNDSEWTSDPATYHRSLIESATLLKLLMGCTRDWLPQHTQMLLESQNTTHAGDFGMRREKVAFVLLDNLKTIEI